MTVNNDLYYSDDIEKSIPLNMSYGTVQYILGEIDAFRNSIHQQLLEWEKEGIVNIMAQFTHSPSTGDIICLITGTKLWDQEKIDAFQQQIKNDKDKEDMAELEIMKSLIQKYPDQVKQILSDAK